jgi:hypothetical protein
VSETLISHLAPRKIDVFYALSIEAKVPDLAIKSNENNVALLRLFLLSLSIYGEVQDVSYCTPNTCNISRTGAFCCSNC